jgi:hypothetical protein
MLWYFIAQRWKIWHCHGSGYGLMGCVLVSSLDTLIREAAGFFVFQTTWHYIPENCSRNAQLLAHECCVNNLTFRYCGSILNQGAVWLIVVVRALVASSISSSGSSNSRRAVLLHYTVILFIRCAEHNFRVLYCCHVSNLWFCKVFLCSVLGCIYSCKASINTIWDLKLLRRHDAINSSRAVSVTWWWERRGFPKRCVS